MPVAANQHAWVAAVQAHEPPLGGYLDLYSAAAP